jgi:hypothetical protein
MEVEAEMQTELAEMSWRVMKMETKLEMRIDVEKGFMELAEMDLEEMEKEPGRTGRHKEMNPPSSDGSNGW